MTTGGAWPIGYRLVSYDQLDSTNDEAKRLAESGEPEGTVVLARSQRRGRGRYGRVWHSAPANLYLSVVLRPACLPAVAAELSFAASLALADTLTSLLPNGGAALAFKWPNDVMINRRKVSGILLETETTGDQQLIWVILGLGLNIASHPDDVAVPATSLIDQGVEASAPEDIAAAFCQQFKAWYDRWTDEGFPPLRTAWLARATGIGERMTVRIADRSVDGVAVAFDERCALVLETDAGDRFTVTAGDIFFGDGG